MKEDWEKVQAEAAKSKDGTTDKVNAVEHNIVCGSTPVGHTDFSFEQ